MKLSRKLAAATLQVAATIALGAALVPVLSSPAAADGYAQAPPFSDTTPAGTAYSTGQLATSGGTGGDTYTQTSGTPDVTVSPSGAVSAPGTLPAGSYPAAGTVTDNSSDETSWSFTLTVTPVTAPTSGSTPAGTAYSTGQLVSSGGTGPYTYTQSSGTPEVTVSSSGAVSAPGTLPVGSYPAAGNVTDSLGDTGHWTFTLTVTPVTITQGPPTSGSTPAGTAYSTGQLVSSGGTGPYTYTQSSGSPEVKVSSAGAVSAPATLSVGSYPAAGNVTDSLGDTTGWSFTLTVSAVTITQGAPTSDTTAAGTAYSGQLATSGGTGSYTYTQSSGSPEVTVSSSGAVSAPATLSVGSYPAAGNVTDSLGDTTGWSFTLTVSAVTVTPGPPTSSSTITQDAPTSNSTTPANSSSFTQQLKTSGNTGSVTFVTTGSSPPGLLVSSSGVVSTKSKLLVGTYTVSGTDSDTFGDKGTWSFTLKVSSSAITQDAPFSNAKPITPATSASFTDQLKTTGNAGSVKFVTKGSGSTPPGVVVSSSGVVSTKRALAVGTYTISGTDSDSLHDAGSWSFTLKVTTTKITQAAPAAARTTTGRAFSDLLRVSGSHGAVTYAQSSGAPDLKVSSSGAVSASVTLRAGTYKAKGTVSDAYRDRGTWSFSLTVTATKITQAAPAAGTTTSGKAFAAQLKVSGSHGSVTYTRTNGAPGLKVSSSGVVSAPARLPKGTYKASGTDADSLGDTGSWSFALTVTVIGLTQIAPTSAQTATSKAFTAQLKFSGSLGAVTCTQTSGAPELKVSSSGAVSAPASLPAGTYKATGTARDTHGDVGSWSFTLTVGVHGLTQVAPTSARTTTGTAFTAQLKVSGSHGAVTYTQSAGAPELKVSSSGTVSASVSLPAGTYKATGTARDTHGDVGSWSFTLTVAATKLAQAAPAAGTTAVGTAFTAQLKVSGSHGAVTYAQSVGAPELKVSSAGAVSAPASLPAGSYKATGTARDTYGDVGSWSFTLTVKANKLTQLGRTTGTTTTGRAFAAQLKVSGSVGAVTYSQSAGAPQLNVSSSGSVSAPANLPAGTYKATGAARDILGDTGTWSLTLTVTASKLTQLAPTSEKTTTRKAFTDQLAVSGAKGTVTYTESAGAPHLKVSSSGKVSAPDTLPAGTYKATGTARDSLGDTGTWSFSLTVKATVLKQAGPLTATVPAGTAFTTQLKFAGSHVKVTFLRTSGAQTMTISSSGKVSAPDTLEPGTYEVIGTAKDGLGDTGTWTFTLTVEGP